MMLPNRIFMHEGGCADKPRHVAQMMHLLESISESALQLQEAAQIQITHASLDDTLWRDL